MKLIIPEYSIIQQEPGLEGIYKQIERAGRNCYKSESKITSQSSRDFVDRMIKNKHFAMLEHGTVYLKKEEHQNSCGTALKYYTNKYSKVKAITTLSNKSNLCTYCITTNLRVLVENEWMNDLKYICSPTKHELRHCIKFVSDIHFYKDITRHRVFSWAIESTRYCNYSKSKFGSKISFATPIWLKDDEQEEFKKDLDTVEALYFKWLKKGWKPQEAAYFLTQGTKADVIMTGFASDFTHFFKLRSSISETGKPHPTVEELVEPLRKEFIKRRY